MVVAYPASIERCSKQFNSTIRNLAVPYGIALSFHRNFYHDSMEDEEIEEYRPVVHQLINRLLNYNGKSNSYRK